MSEFGRKATGAGALAGTTLMLLLAGCGSSGESGLERYQNGHARNTRIGKAAERFVRAVNRAAKSPQDSWIPSTLTCSYEDDSTDTGPSGRITYVREPLSHTRPGDSCSITLGAKQQVEVTLSVTKPDSYNLNAIEGVSVTSLAGCSVELIPDASYDGVWGVFDGNKDPVTPAQARADDIQGLACLTTVAHILQ